MNSSHINKTGTPYCFWVDDAGRYILTSMSSGLIWDPVTILGIWQLMEMDDRHHRLLAFMGLLPDTLNCGLRMRRKCFPRHRLQRKPLVSDPGMHHGTCVTHVPWCMSGSLFSGGGENVPGIPGACATRNFTYLARGPWACLFIHVQILVFGMRYFKTAASSFIYTPFTNRN